MTYFYLRRFCFHFPINLILHFGNFFTFKITENDADYMKSSYKKYFDMKIALTKKDSNVVKRASNLTNEILSEKIILEKIRLEESEEISKLRRIEEERDNIQKEAELSEQRDTLIKFELTELKRNHEDLKKALANMKRENLSTVEPVLAKLNEEVSCK